MLTYKCGETWPMVVDLQPLSVIDARFRDIFPTSEHKTIFSSNESPLPLNTLPLEMIYTIFDSMDLPTILNVKATNNQYASLVSNYRPFKQIFQHALHAVHNLLHTNLAYKLTCKDIFDVLCTQGCFTCGNFGNLLDLFTGRRHCSICVSNSGEFSCIRPKYAEIFGLKNESIATLTTLISLRNGGQRSDLIRLAEVVAAAPTGYHEKEVYQEWRNTYDTRQERSSRDWGVMSIPVLDPKAGVITWGLYCRSCIEAPYKYNAGPSPYTLYSDAQYREHFKRCPGSQKGRKFVAQYIAPDGSDPEKRGSEQHMLDAQFHKHLGDLMSETNW